MAQICCLVEFMFHKQLWRLDKGSISYPKDCGTNCVDAQADATLLVTILVHYVNMPMQYTVNFKVGKN